jgi:hypothetical protein
VIVATKGETISLTIYDKGGAAAAIERRRLLRAAGRPMMTVALEAPSKQ